MQNKNQSNDLDSLFTEQEAAAFTRFTQRALQAWRVNGKGPRFVRISSRAIRYRRQDLIDWIEAKLRNSTSDTGGAQ